MSGLRSLTLPGGRVVDSRHLEVRYARSSGPGGQRTNKVETKVDLRLDLDGAAEVFSPSELGRLRARLGSRLDKDGMLQVVSQLYRDRPRNLEDAHLRMEELLAEALKVQKRRRATKPTRGAKRRRLADKKRRSEVKQGRGRVRSED